MCFYAAKIRRKKKPQDVSECEQQKEKKQVTQPPREQTASDLSQRESGSLHLTLPLMEQWLMGTTSRDGQSVPVTERYIRAGTVAPQILRCCNLKETPNHLRPAAPRSQTCKQQRHVFTPLDTRLWNVCDADRMPPQHFSSGTYLLPAAHFQLSLGEGCACGHVADHSRSLWFA